MWAGTTTGAQRRDARRDRSTPCCRAATRTDRLGEQYGAAMMGMGGLGPDGRRRQRLVAGVIVAAMLLATGAVLLGTVL